MWSDWSSTGSWALALRHSRLAGEEEFGEERIIRCLTSLPKSIDAEGICKHLAGKVAEWAVREPHPPFADLPKDIFDAIDQLRKKVMDATPTEAHGEHDVDKLDFVTVSKKVSLRAYHSGSG